MNWMPIEEEEPIADICLLHDDDVFAVRYTDIFGPDPDNTALVSLKNTFHKIWNHIPRQHQQAILRAWNTKAAFTASHRIPQIALMPCCDTEATKGEVYTLHGHNGHCASIGLDHGDLWKFSKDASMFVLAHELAHLTQEIVEDGPDGETWRIPWADREHENEANELAKEWTGIGVDILQQPYFIPGIGGDQQGAERRLKNEIVELSKQCPAVNKELERILETWAEGETIQGAALLAHLKDIARDNDEL